MSSEGYHESLDLLSPGTVNMHRAITSLKEELEAIDWYQQRADATTDDELKDNLLHNMNEEIEHACMMLEWIRRHSPKFDHELRIYLFTEGPITEAEQRATAGGSAGAEGVALSSRSGSLAVGSLKGKE